MPAMQTCTKCNETKSVEEFSWRNKKRAIRHKRCKDCNKVYQRKHYNANQKRYVKKAKHWNDANRAEYKARLRRYAIEHLIKNPCVDCGEKNPLVLDFDHVRDEKVASVSTLISNVTSLKRLKVEIAKCEIRCANCHRLKTAKEEGWHILELMAEYGLDT
ncbi:MAG: hypothetical protein AAFR81_08715 [Chloroflexota bacterium]